MTSLASWCLRHRRMVLLLWIVALIGFSAADKIAKPAYSTKFQLAHTPSADAAAVLKADFRASSGDSDQIVLQSTSGTLSAPATKTRVESMLAEVAKLPYVGTVISPFGPTAKAQISRDGTIAFATVDFTELAQSLPKAAVDKVISTAQAADSGSLRVELNGQAIEQVAKQQSMDSTGLGVVFALLVLGLVFGALLAAVIPIITALIAIGIGFAFTGLMSHVFAVASFVPILGVLIGLGVGVDYALFILTRHRNGLRAGRSVEESAAIAANTAGRAVFFAGITVCVALLGQFALGVSFLYGLAIAGTVTVGLTMFASLTLLPALLGFFGLKVLSRRERARLLADGPAPEQQAHGFWYRWARWVEKRPTVLTVVATAVVVVIALPVLTLRLGLADAGSDPTTSTTRQAYDLLAEGFGPGFNGPLDLVGTLQSPSDLAAFDAVVKAVAAEKGIVAVSPARLSLNGKAAIALAYPATAPQAAETSSILHRLRNTVIPRAEAGTGVTVLVGGATAAQDDFAKVLASKLPLFIGVVVILAFLLLMTVFRSLLIPFVASVMNLLSVGAALGIMNAVFEWGWGLHLLGITRTGPVEVFIPVIMFSILFGLSMDYEVFLVSRMREEWVHSNNNEEAITIGQSETGRVITAAALIMILVFLSFLLGGSLIIKQFGIGLAFAIIVDAFIVRTVLVPALMHVMGRSNWWLPGWLERALPRLAIEAAEPPPPVVLEPAVG